MFRKLHDPGPEGVTVFIDGVAARAEREESVAAVLLRTPPFHAREAAGAGRRAPFCLMGVCFECLVRIDGVASSRACLAQVRDGMRIERQSGDRALKVPSPT